MPCSVPANTARMQLELFFVPSFSQTGKRLPLSSQKRAQGKKSDNKPWSYLGVLQGKFREAEQARQKGIKTIETPSKADDPVGKLAGLPTSAYNHRRSCTSTLILSVKAACTIRSTTIEIAGSASTKNRVRQSITYEYSGSFQSADSKLDMKFPASVPALFITGTADAALPLSMSERSPKYFAEGSYRRTVVNGAGHWMLQVSLPVMHTAPLSIRMRRTPSTAMKSQIILLPGQKRTAIELNYETMYWRALTSTIDACGRTCDSRAGPRRACHD